MECKINKKHTLWQLTAWSCAIFIEETNPKTQRKYAVSSNTFGFEIDVAIINSLGGMLVLWTLHLYSTLVR